MSKEIFNYIKKEYGKNVLAKVQSDEHKTVVSKLLKSAESQGDNIEHAGNKIIAMLRMNP